jgi:F-type H+-transporting ATPase subunit alpha
MNINTLESIMTNEINNKNVTNNEIGIVTSIFNNIVIAEGLPNCIYGEKVIFENEIEGIVYFLGEDLVKILVISNAETIKEGFIINSTGKLFYISIPKNFIKLFNNTWELTDLISLKHENAEIRPIDIIPPGVIERDFVKESLHTGILLIDSLIPIGKGQRELIIGNINSGKSALGLDMIISQKKNIKKVYCIYVAIGQKASTVKRTEEILQKQDVMSYTMIITANASHSSTSQYIAPYLAMTIAEYIKDEGHDVLIVFDDLTQHAIAYREINLLLKNIPGREAYSGDIFYIHARLLERCGKFKKGGSITGIPIISTHDIASYIPTNVISITDGQIFLDTDLFNKGQKPAINIGISVSRLGGAVQGKFMKKVCSSLKIDLASSEELEKFLQFSSDIDDVSKKIIEKGRNIKNIFKQKTCSPYELWEEIVILFILTNDLIKNVNKSIFYEIFDTIKKKHLSIINNINKDILIDETLKELKDIIYVISNNKESN